MADELPEVEQRFRADLAGYVEPIKAAAEETQSFADKNAEAAGAVADLDHELHDQTESYFALAAALDAAGLAWDEYGAQQRLANSDASGLEATLTALRDELGDMALGDALQVGKTGMNQFAFAVQDAGTRMQRAKADAEDLGRDIKSTGLAADEGFMAGRAALDDFESSLSRLRNDIARMEMGPNLSRIVDSAVADVAGGGGGGGGFRNALSRLLGGGDSLGSALASSGGLALVAGAGAAIGALIQEIGLVIAGFVAAGAGVAAFAALALPTFDKIKNSYEGISTAQKNYRAAVQLEARDPSTSNLTAEKDALAKLQIAWADVPRAIRPAIREIDDFKRSYDKLVKAFEPVALKVFTLALRGLNTLLPDLKPLADAAGGAIEGLLRQFDRFAGSKDFKDWLSQFDKISGPAITAIGQGIGNVAVNFGKLITALPKQDVVNAINIFFRTISGSLTGIEWIAIHVAHNWDDLSKRIARGWRDIAQWAKDGARDWDRAGNDIIHWADDIGSGVQKAFGYVRNALDENRADILRWAGDVEQTWDTAWNKVTAFAAKVPGMILHALGDLGSLLVREGEALISGLISGIEHEIPGLTSAVSTVRRLLDDIGGFLTGGGGGGSTTAGSKAGPALPLVPVTGGNQPAAIHVHVDMSNTMTTPAAQQALQRHVQAAVLGFANQNAGSMLVLPGRRS